MDYDDHALILPSEEYREVVETVSGSGMPIRDCLIRGIEMESTCDGGAFFGARAAGRNFRRLLEAHPTYIDPMSSLAGGYMVNFNSYRKGGWPKEHAPTHLHEGRNRYQLLGGIGASQHFCQDLGMGLSLGWDGIVQRIEKGKQSHPDRSEFFDALLDVVIGIQTWIQHHILEAKRMASNEANPQLRKNLMELANINERLQEAPAATFREACQWILWFQMTARMYNGSGSLGRLDLLLTPFYERDKAMGSISDEEAMLHIASLLARDTAYIQLGGPDEQGCDVTNKVSFLVLEAAHKLKIPVNVGVCVGRDLDSNLLRRGVEILLEDKLGSPKFLGTDRTIEGFVRNGYPLELARQRAYSGCHWSAIPGREYTMNDCVKISFGTVFDLALREMKDPSIENLWQGFEHHLREAVRCMADSLDFHLRHMHEVFPELVLDLLCHGPLDHGRDASDAFHGGVEFYNLCIDGCALATVADSFAAIEQRVVREGRLTWKDLIRNLDENWAGPKGEQVRLMMKHIPKFGSGGSLADDHAVRIAQLFTRIVKEQTPPAGCTLIPGIFSWANTLSIGKSLGATPNGRFAGDPISHGANPDPGFRHDGAPSALALAVASVQSGYGNASPMQIELSPSLCGNGNAVSNLCQLIRTHFELGGTQINMNLLDPETLRLAHENPSSYPNLIVRVTGFSAYFSSLSPEFRQLVVDRVLGAESSFS